MEVKLDSDGFFRIYQDGGIDPFIPSGQTPDELFEELVRMLGVLSDPDSFGGEPRSSCWARTRSAHLKNFPSCAACGSKKDLVVHHIEPFSLNPSRECDLSNTITFCPFCHLLFGHLKSFLSYNPSVVEDASWFLDKVKERP
jgi:hypothetical protein